MKQPSFNPITGQFNDKALEREAQASLWQDRRNIGIGVTSALLVALTAFLAPSFVDFKNDLGHYLAPAIEIVAIVGLATALTLLIKNRPGPAFDIALFVPSLCLTAFLVTVYLSGQLPWDTISSILMISAFIYGVFLPHRPPFAIATLVLLLGTYFGCLDSAEISSDPMAMVMFMLIWTICVLTVRGLAIAQRRSVFQQSQYERLATQLENNLQDLEIENRAVERAAEENAALADDLALARMEAEQNAYYLENILENIAQGVAVLDENLRITKFNSAYRELAGIPAHLAKVGTHIEEIVRDALDRGLYVDEETRNLIIDALERPGGLLVKEPTVLERPQGNGRYVEVRRNPLPDGGEVSTYTDITDRRRADELMRSQAMRDPLTDLSNRFHYAERLNEAIARSKRNGRYVALAYLDLDLFKPVNDAHGHAVGDAVLCDFASVLRAHTREADTVARLGGDEFAIIFNDVESISDVTNPIERIMISTGEPSTICGVEIRIGISVGVALYPLDAMTAEGLSEAADHALYAAKKDGRACYRLSQAFSRLNTQISSSATG